jgi:hypothetical protein
MATNIIRLVPDGGSTYVADYHWTTYRYLLSNGNTIDVRAIDDGSWLRDEVLKVANGLEKLPDRVKLDVIIAGSTTLPEPTEGEEKPKTPRKRLAKKQVA